MVQERFAAGEVDLAHARGFEQGQTAPHVGLGGDVARLLGVEAEPALGVTFTREVVVDRDGLCW